MKSTNNVQIVYRCIMILDNWLICTVKKTSSKGGCRCYASLPASPFPLFKKCNYSPKCPWLIVDVYLATSWLGKNLPPATFTWVNSC